MEITVMGVPVRLGVRIGQGGCVAFSPDWPVIEVRGHLPIPAMKELASAIEADMARTLHARREELLRQTQA